MDYLPKWMFPKIVGFPPKSSHFKIGFSTILTIHFGVVSLIFGNTQISGWKFQKYRKNHHLDLDELMEPRYGALGSSWSWSSSNSAEWSDLRGFPEGFRGGGRNHTEALGAHRFGASCNRGGFRVQLGHFLFGAHFSSGWHQTRESVYICMYIYIYACTLYIVYVDSPRFCWGDRLFFELYSTNASLLSTVCECIMLREWEVCVSQVNDWFGKALWLALTNRDVAA